MESDFNEGYIRALQDLRNNMISPLKQKYSEKAIHTSSRPLKRFFSNKVYILDEIEKWIISIERSKETLLKH